ncbi:hypothetical protein PTKIN_Ptkin16aG0085300 [Pterospermum kingtungense]
MRNFRVFSSVWKNITSPLYLVDDYPMQLVNGMGFALGNGVRTMFWSQEWIPGTILRSTFPRICNLASCKDGTVVEFGSLQDKLIWKNNTSAMYTAKSYCLSYLGVHFNDHSGRSKLWTAYLPPKVELFCWQLLQVNLSMPKKDGVVRNLQCWTPPLAGVVKFNVYGSLFGKPGPAVIGGVLRDHVGTELIQFSKYVGIEDSNVAEIMAIREALVQFLSSSWANCSKLIIESHSKIAIGMGLENHKVVIKDVFQGAFILLEVLPD